jgi:hypothetical protein
VTRNIATRLLSVAAGLLLGPLAACNCGAPTVTCGTGTSAKNNQCLPDVKCGAGTTATNGSCVPTNQLTCGAGTTQTGTECTATLSCGAGTTQQGTSCVVTGPTLSCGPGTTADASNVCQVTNPLTCGVGTANQNNVCVPSLNGGINANEAATGLGLVLDAAPSPDGTTFYFVAQVTDGQTGDTSHTLFSVPADGSAAPTAIAGGFTLPINIAVSTDNADIFVADMGFEDNTDPTKAVAGALFDVKVSSGASTQFASTLGFRVRGVTVFNDGTNDHVIFTGTDPASGLRGVFDTDPAGAAVNTIDTDAAFTDPSGVAAVSLTEVFVVDTSGSDTGLGALFKVTGAGAPTLFASDLKVGYPAGCATSLDGKKALVSGIDDTNHVAVVFVVDLTNGTVTSTSQGIGNQAESGGIHRGDTVDTFAWAGIASGNSGTVFKVTFN